MNDVIVEGCRSCLFLNNRPLVVGGPPPTHALRCNAMPVTEDYILHSERVQWEPQYTPEDCPLRSGSVTVHMKLADPST